MDKSKQKLTEKLKEKIADHPDNCRCHFCNRKRLQEIVAKVAQKKLKANMPGQGSREYTHK